MATNTPRNSEAPEAPEVLEAAKIAEEKAARIAAYNEKIKKEHEEANKMVKVRLFKDNDKYKEPVFVGVNGNNFLIKRGVEVEVPSYVKEVLDNTLRAEESFQKLNDELRKDE